ncbi:hypothetical protein RND81_01G146700 [Saponaria officinalis]|uniref:Reverse transcriptase zinc-binding domain-containing protein n=1 Tax=Saponaria officinalis TaxID=3572 RepID=A0AAW1N7S2_SAPOF
MVTGGGQRAMLTLSNRGMLGFVLPVIWFGGIILCGIDFVLLDIVSYVGYQRLQTRLRMSKFGYNGELWCCICASDVESEQHLFFECRYSVRCVQVIEDKLGICIPRSGTFVWWVHHNFKTLFEKKVVGAAIVAFFYYVWRARNHSLHNGVVIRPEIWIKTLLPDLAYRCNALVNDDIRMKYGSWIAKLS